MDGISTMLQRAGGRDWMIKVDLDLFSSLPLWKWWANAPAAATMWRSCKRASSARTRACKFAIWKNNKWWAAKKKQPTKAVVTALLKDGRAGFTGCYSEELGNTYRCHSGSGG